MDLNTEHLASRRNGKQANLKRAVAIQANVIDYREVYERVRERITLRYGITVEDKKFKDGNTGDLDGAKIAVDPRLQRRNSLFVLLHLFGHTVQWNCSDEQREVGYRNYQNIDDDDLRGVTAYEVDGQTRPCPAPRNRIPRTRPLAHGYVRRRYAISDRTVPDRRETLLVRVSDRGWHRCSWGSPYDFPLGHFRPAGRSSSQKRCSREPHASPGGIDASTLRDAFLDADE